MCRHRARPHMPLDDNDGTCRHARRGGIFSSLVCCIVGAGVFILLANGCEDRGLHGWLEETEELTLPTIGTRRVSIKTANGYVQVRPAEEGSDTIMIRAIIRAEARGSSDARQCRDAIEIATPVAGDDEAMQEISWAWGEPRQPGWSADVSFEITIPVDLDVAAQTENGRIDIVGILGDCRVKSDNGAIRVVASTGHLTADTNNGEITIESPAGDVSVRATNGRVKATLTNEQSVGGKIETTNGSVSVALRKTAAVDLECRTVHGSVRNKLPLEDSEKRTSRKGKRSTQLNGKLAGGGAALDLQTTNGDIVLEPYVPRRSAGK